MYNHIQLKHIARITLISLIVVASAIFAGLVASTGNLLIVALVVLFFAGLVLLSQPTILLFMVLMGGLVATGLSQLYVPQIQIIRWGISAISVILGCLALVYYYLPNSTKAQKVQLPDISWWLLAFMVLSIFTALINLQDIGTFAVGFKGYFQIWGLFIALMLMRWPLSLMESMPKVIIWTALIQLPFVLHQFLFIVPRRKGLGHGIVPEDVIAGTFGASALGGGSNAVLSAFLFVVMAIIISYWKHGLITSYRVGAACLLLLAPVMVNLSKISLFYLLLIAIILFKEDISKRPGRFIVGSVFTVFFMFLIMMAYTSLQPDSKRGDTLQDFISRSIESNVSEGAGHGSYDLNRFTSVTYWAKEQYRTNSIIPALIGHGLAEAREGKGGTGLASTLAQKKYSGIGIGLTSISAILWETGVVGLILILGAFWSAYRTAAKLAFYYQTNPKMSAMFNGLQAGVAVLALSLAHKNVFVSHMPYQTIVLFIFGYLAYWDMQARSKQ